jgi:hypothetical protein
MLVAWMARYLSMHFFYLSDCRLLRGVSVKRAEVKLFDQRGVISPPVHHENEITDTAKRRPPKNLSGPLQRFHGHVE